MKNQVKEKNKKRLFRKRKVRARVLGTSNVPRLSVFKSNKHIYAQLIDDGKGRTLVSASDLELEKGKSKKADKAQKVGEIISQKAGKLNIKKIVFDRSGYKYHGRIKSLAEGGRKGGLKF